MKLEIQDLSVAYDSETGAVLKDLSLNVTEGEFLSLLGPSGCGKSTLMKTIAGILTPRKGSIRLDGREITSLPIHKRGTVIVFQDMRLFPHKTVEENVAFPLKMQGVPRAQRLERARALLEKVQLPGFGSRMSGELSGGQQQRVALARALAAQPKLLLLDEPFSALDENLREDMRSLVLQLKREFQMTVILVTHDREEALSMSDRVALMFDGRILQCASPREVYSRPVSRQAADYFGNCVYIPGRVSGGVFTAPGISCAATVEDGNYDLMLRPEQLELGHPGGYDVTVEDVVFRGTDTVLALRSEDGTVWKKSFFSAPHWTAGEQVEAQIILSECVLFKR